MSSTQRRRAHAPVEHDIVYSPDLVTPHVKWAEPYAKGPIRAFIVGSVHEGRTVVELQQRMSLDARVMSIDPRWDVNKWCIDRYAEFDPLPANDYSKSYQILAPELAAKHSYDVLVMHSIIGWNDIPKQIRQAVHRRVKSGEGLVLVHPQLGEKQGDTDLWDLSPLVAVPPTRLTAEGAGMDEGYPDPPKQAISKKPWAKAADHYVVNGIPFDALPYGALKHYVYQLGTNSQALATDKDGAPVVAVKHYGKGRVVSLAYHNYALFPELDTRRGERNETFWEYLFSLLMRSIIWAAGKEPQVQLGALDVSPHRLNAAEVGSGATAVRVRNRGARVRGKIEVTFRNEQGELEGETRRSVELSKGEQDVTVPLPKTGAASGQHLVDVRLSAAGKQQDWGTATYEVRRQARVTKVVVDADAVAVGKTLSGRARLAGDVRGLRLIAELWDLTGRLLSREEKSTLRGKEVPFRLKCTDALANHGWVKCTLLEGDRYVHEARTQVALTAPRRNWRDYEVIMPWAHNGVWPWTDLVEGQYRRAGITSLSETQWNFPLTLSMHPPGFGVYWYRRFPYLERKDNYRKTRDRKWLERVPCIHTDDFRKPVARALRRGIPPILKYSPLAYYVADESSITCYEDANDLCWSDATLAAFRKWLRRWYGDLARLNAEWETRYRSWEKVMPVTYDEAQQRGNPAPWLDHRLFMNTTLADAFKYSISIAQKVDPDGLVTISGTQLPGSHNGCDWSKIDKIVEYLQPYSGGGQDEMHRSFNPNMILTGFTGYAMSGIPLEYEVWHRFLHGHRGASIFWGYSMLDPDLSLNAQGRSLERCFSELHGEGLCRAIAGLKRKHDKVAIHFSMASGHAWWISDGKLKLEGMEYGVRTSANFRRFIQSRVAWGAVLEDLGYQYNYVPYSDVEGKGLSGYRVLVLPGSVALSAEEVEQIKLFVKRGGLVLADEMPGQLDVHGKKLPEASLAELFDEAGYGRGRAVLLRRWLDQYSDQRMESHGEELRQQVRRELEDSGVKPEVQVTAAGQFPVAVERVSWSGGGVEALALLKEPAGRFGQSADGVNVYEPVPGMKASERVHVQLPQKGHWYDLRSHKYLGVRDEVRMTLKEADPSILAVLPYEVRGMTVRISGGERAGEPVRYEAKVNTGSARPVRHVFKAEVFGPDGKKHALYSCNLDAANGRAQGAFQLALNDPRGTWRLRITDVFSGQKSEKTWTVR